MERRNIRPLSHERNYTARGGYNFITDYRIRKLVVQSMALHKDRLQHVQKSIRRGLQRSSRWEVEVLFSNGFWTQVHKTVNIAIA
jgi:hypothetical protein